MDPAWEEAVLEIDTGYEAAVAARQRAELAKVKKVGA